MGSILGIGIDVVAIDRFEESLERTPGLLTRVFTPNEAKLNLSKKYYGFNSSVLTAVQPNLNPVILSFFCEQCFFS